MKRIWLAVLVALAVGNADAKTFGTIEGPATANDGDDLIINGQDYRLSGIDAFEAGQMCKDIKAQAVPCGQMAKAALAQMIDRGNVSCQDTGKRDGARVIALSTIGNLDIQEEMVRIGWAFVRPDFAGAQTQRLCAIEADAAKARRGGWALSWFERPYFVKGGRKKTLQQISCRHAWAR